MRHGSASYSRSFIGHTSSSTTIEQERTLSAPRSRFVITLKDER